MTKKKLAVTAFLVLSLMPLSCTLNPLNGFLSGISVQIISIGGLTATQARLRARAGATQNLLSVPTSVPTKAADFDCIAFNVTGYGIEEREGVAGSQVPIASLRLGLETPMQSPAANPSLNFNVKVPTLLGVDPNLQKRQIQVLGVYTALADKSSCDGKTLYDFLVNDDPNAAVYVIGSDFYPSEDATCVNNSLCIRDDIVFNGTPGVELIYYYLAPEQLEPEFVFVNSDENVTGSFLFSDSDIYSKRGAFYNGNSSQYLSKPTAAARVPRIDFYFPISKYKMNRVLTGYAELSFGSVKAANYPLVSSTCGLTATPASYSNLQLKVWNGTTQAWMNMPNNGSTADVIIPAANLITYTLNYIEIYDDSVQTELIDGTEYLIISLRATEATCSSILLNSAPRIKFY